MSRRFLVQPLMLLLHRFQRRQRMKRDLLVLIVAHLRTDGYLQSAEVLESEAGMCLRGVMQGTIDDTIPPQE